MPSVTSSTVISTPVGRIWEILNRLDIYEDWEPGYVSSRYESDQHGGVGTTRRVELKSPMGVRWAIHEVTRWDENETIAWAARESNFPFLADAEQTVTLRREGQETLVGNDVVYELKYGPLGGLVDVLMFRRVAQSAADGFVASLKMAAE